MGKLELFLHGQPEKTPVLIKEALAHVQFEQLGVVKEITGQKRNRLYSYVEYIRIMNEGTELPT